jgi:hypothetical protein
MGTSCQIIGRRIPILSDLAISFRTLKRMGQYPEQHATLYPILQEKMTDLDDQIANR